MDVLQKIPLVVLQSTKVCQSGKLWEIV